MHSCSGTPCGGKDPGQEGAWGRDPRGLAGRKGGGPAQACHPCVQGICGAKRVREPPRLLPGPCGPLHRQHCPWKAFPRPRQLALPGSRTHPTTGETRKCPFSGGARLLVVSLTKGSLRAQGPFPQTETTGLLPENPLRPVGRALDTVCVAGTLDVRCFLVSIHPRIH